MNVFTRLKGFTYIGLLFAVAILGASLAILGTVWKTSKEREKEVELLFVGDQFRKAIGLYYERTPGPIKEYPKSFDQLTKDDRYLVPQHYLRRVYRDPVTKLREWGIINAPDGSILGVYSTSSKKPHKQANFKTTNESFENAKSYSDWKFVYVPNQNLAIDK